jgi:hypothetical protein
MGNNDFDYTKEFIWGINKNTSSGLIGGFIFKHSKAITPKMFRTLGLEIINIKHPKEVRYNSPYTGNFFIWGKTNYLYALRFQYGRDFVLFKKAPQQGVQITGVSAAGPSIGILAPYYIEYLNSNNSAVREQYSPEKHNFQNILGTGHLFQGLGESKLRIGANVKLGMRFEFGTFKSNVTGFEVGFLVDGYLGNITMVPKAPKNSNIYPTSYITLFYGTRK